MSTTPPKLAFDLNRDVQVVVAMASRLTPYLYENELYGYLANDMPRLTVGGLLLRLYRLTRLEAHLDANQQTRVNDARINFEAECAKWAVHYERKLQRELQARITALEYFLGECSDDRAICAAGYPTQAEKRTMIQHLQDEAAEHNVLSPETQARVIHVDEHLRRVVRASDFITDDRLKDVYPAAQFWWLYRHIPEEQH
ncbi:MAG: hypothetical protein K8S97_09595 [Anaerolineae bacterium]|nr:hypothetical protein [Anaerolineae bacterium]